MNYSPPLWMSSKALVRGTMEWPGPESMSLIECIKRTGQAITFLKSWFAKPVFDLWMMSYLQELPPNLVSQKHWQTGGTNEPGSWLEL